jgi:hypothetical protein
MQSKPYRGCRPYPAGKNRNLLVLSPLKLVIIVSLALFSPASIWAQLGGTGTIEGTVTDPSGAVVPGAKVTGRNVATRAEVVRITTSSGLYTLAPLDAGDYVVTIAAPGFETLVRENIHVDGMQVLALNLNMRMGSANQTVTVTSAPPQLDTSSATLGGTLENEIYQSLPLEMGGANGISTDQRRATDSALLLPGVTNNETKNNESDEPMVINGNASATEMYIEGIPLDSASTSGDPRYIWSAFSVETVNQFQVKTTGYSAEYQGLGVENFTIKSGTNNFHGSAYDVFRNTALDAAGFIPAQYPSNYPVASLAGTYYKPPEHMNEYGISLGGPIWRNKLFFFGNYMGFRFSALTKPQAQTIPTPAELCGDFSTAAINIYDPTTQTKGSGTSYSRTQFSGPSYTSAGCGTGPIKANVIPQNEISPTAQYLQKFWQGVPYLNDNLTNNYLGAYSYGLNNWSTTGRIDADLSDKHQLSLILAAGRQGLVGPAGSQTTNVGPLPYLYAKTYAPVTRVLIFQDTYVISPSIVNQFKYGAAQYHSPDSNPTYGVADFAASAAGITGLPGGQASGSFPVEKFTGTNAPAQWGPQTGYVGNTDTYSVLDNVQWLHGKHSVTFGGQYEWLSYNYLYADGGTTLTTLNFGVNETAQVSGSSAGVVSGTGLPYASYLLGAVDSGTYTQYAPIAQETGSRYHPFAFYANDDYKLTNKLTVNAGLRWDLMPPMREAENRFSFLNPTMSNPVTGSAGALQFAGSGPDSCGCTTPMHTYYKNWGPRLGLAYAVTGKTVIRASYGIYYAHGGGTSGGATALPSTTMELGFAAAPNPVSPGDSLPAFYLNNSAYFTGGTNGAVANTAFGTSNVAAPPVYNASYGTYYSSAAGGPYKVSSTLAYLDPYYGGRTPAFGGWSAGFQTQVTRDMTATVSYVGNQGHFLLPTGAARGYYSNQLDPKYLALGKTALGATATAANMPTGALPYSTFNNKVSQALLAFPQYSGVTDQVASVGNANYNGLQLSIVQRLSRGLTFMLNYTYSKAIDDLGTFRSGYAIPAGALAYSSKAWSVDRIERARSVIDQPQNLIFTSTYDLPFGQGKIGSGNALVRNIAGGWRLSGIFSYYAGDPLAVTEGSCTAPSQGTCMPTYNPDFVGVASGARLNGGWGHGATRTSLSSTQYINPAAFVMGPGNAGTSNVVNPNCTAGTASCTGMVIGNVARTAPYGLRGPGNNNIDAALRRTFDLWKKENVKFIFEASVFNAVNHVWFGSASSTADGSIGTTTGSDSLGVIAGQANNPRQWQFAGHINF